jgi:putative multiple sugar transport system permease protein
MTMSERKMSLGAFFQKYTMVIALVVVVVFFAIATGGGSLKPGSINNLISQNGYVFVLAAGMLCCILTGGNIDLSVGSVVCFTASIGCVMMDKGANMWLAVVAMLAIGLAIGVFQGFWIAKIHVPAFIATLSGMYAFRGLSNVVLQGYRVDISNEKFLFLFGGGRDCYIPDFVRQWMGSEGKPNLTCLAIGIIAILIYVLMTVRQIHIQKKLNLHQSILGQVVTTAVISAVVLFVTWQMASFRGMPTVLIWIALVLGIYQYITTKTAMGRHLYAVGGNEKATALSGVKTRNVYWFAYASIGLMAGLAGILTAARAKGIDPTYGEGYEMDAIASCFIGGASAYGGTGKVSGMIIGAVLMGVINQGMNMVGVDSNLQRVVKGLVLLAAVIFDVMSKRQKR